MGRSRGENKKPSDDEDGSGGGEEVSASPTPPETKRRRGRPAHKPRKDDVQAEEDDNDAREVEADADDDGAKLVVRPAGNDADTKGSTAETGGGKKRRRRRQRGRVKRGSGDDGPVAEDGVGGGHVRAKSSGRGFRPRGSRRKSTPRRAAEAGLQCK